MGTKYSGDTIEVTKVVSIQLMSPASGDLSKEQKRDLTLTQVSIQLMSPASGDLQIYLKLFVAYILNSFHSINVPSEWGQQ